jgi:AcrR family transcriptional regulator
MNDPGPRVLTARDRSRRAAGAATTGRVEPDSTREALLESGRILFAERGFEGASVRAITAAAGANLGAITYHFGSKEAFYDEVIDTSLAPFVEVVVAAIRGAPRPLDRAEAVVRSYFGYLGRHPEIPRLLMQSLLSTGLPPKAALRHMRRLLKELVGVVEDGQGEGEIRPGDARVLALGMISQAVYVTMMRVPLLTVANVDLEDGETREWLLEELVRFVRGGLASESEGRRT